MPSAEPATGAVQLAVVLYFDAAAEAAVRALVQRLAVSGFAPATALQPHITLAVCEGLDVERFRPALEELAMRTPRLPCTLASIGVFPSQEGVIFLAPAASADLVELQEQVVDRLARRGGQVAAYWLRGSWVPHCTLVIGVPRERIPTALGVAIEAFRPIPGHLWQLSLFNVTTGQSQYAFNLSTGQ